MTAKKRNQDAACSVSSRAARVRSRPRRSRCSRETWTRRASTTYFESYSTYREIKDARFHALRKAYLAAKSKLAHYIGVR